ncbi:aldehyde dehydrogenase family protein, partial [Staphylococcus aureus]
MDVIAPSTGAVITDVARATVADVDAAVAAARAAFDHGPWPRMSSRERAASCSAPTRSCASAPRSWRRPRASTS